MSEDGTVLDGGDATTAPAVPFPDDSLGSPICYFGATVFSHFDVYIAGRKVESADLYGYRAYFETVLSLCCDAVGTHASAELFYPYH